MIPVAHFDFDKPEYFRAQASIWQHNPGRRTAVAVAIALPAAAFWFGVARDWRQMSTMQAVTDALPALILASFYIVLFFRLPHTLASSALKKDPTLHGAQTRAVDERGLQIIGGDVTREMLWADVLRAVESDEFFLFFHDRRSAYYVPKRVLDGEVANWRAMLQDRLPGRVNIQHPPSSAA